MIAIFRESLGFQPGCGDLTGPRWAASLFLCALGVVTSAVAALDYSAERRPDVIVLDIGLPDTDGFGVLRNCGGAATFRC